MRITLLDFGEDDYKHRNRRLLENSDGGRKQMDLCGYWQTFRARNSCEWPVLLILSALFVTLSSAAIAAPLNIADFSIVSKVDGKTVGLNQNMTDVVKKLGPPLNTSIELNQPPAENAWDVFRYQYDKLVIGFMRNWPTLEFIKLESSSYRTPRGIGIGNSDEDVQRMYGDPIAKSGSTIIYQIDVPAPEEPSGITRYSIAFELKSKRVTVIWINVAGE